MKKYGLAALLAAAGILVGCQAMPSSTLGQTTITTTWPTASVTVPSTTVTPTTQPNITQPPETLPTSPENPVIIGWMQDGDDTYFYLKDGTMATGWVEIAGERYYFGEDGSLYRGLLQSYGGLYYLDENGVMQSGWQTVAGKQYYFCAAGFALTGWQPGWDGEQRYLLADGTMAQGWTQIGWERYYFAEDGVAATGWVELEEKTYFFATDGRMQTGWQQGLDGRTRYLCSDGTMAIGWLEIGENSYYFDEYGRNCRGWLELDGKRYYFRSDGVRMTGWAHVDGKDYYFREDGSMAQGQEQINDKNHYFTSNGQEILLVNSWNYVPEDYVPDLVHVNRFHAYSDLEVIAECYEPLMQMLSDCQAAGYGTYIVSAYRTQQFQTSNYQRKVNEFINQGYDVETAKILAAQVVAIPGTSEHQLGMAVDIVDKNWPYLNNAQADMPAQKWLMEHCWEYGFILRYPAGKTQVTGIIYEPWHYRYVGKALAAELHACGLTLEEYLAELTEEVAETVSVS